MERRIRKLALELVPNYENDNSDLPSAGVDKFNVNKENPIARLTLDMSPIQRRNRVHMIAQVFTSKLNDIVYDKIKELDERAAKAVTALSKANDKGDTSAIRDAVHEIKQIEEEKKLYNDAYEGRKAIMKQEGTTPMDIFKWIKKDLQDAANDEKAVTPERRELFQKTVDNYQLLVEEACAILENTEHVRIVFKQNDYHNGTITTKRTSSDIVDTSTDVDTEESQFDDDEDGKRVEGNAGWTYQARFTDPSTTLSRITKTLISSIRMIGNDGLEMYDDLDRPIYMDEGYVHTVLLAELKDMVSPDDFATTDDEGNIKFPALEKAAKKYPWIEQIINFLDEHSEEYYDDRGTRIGHPEYISAFYADLRKDFIPYWMQYFTQKEVTINGKKETRWIWVNKQMNLPTARESTLAEVRSNYEHGYKLDGEAVYEIGGKLNRNVASEGTNLVDEAFSTFSEYQGYYDEYDDTKELRDAVDKATRAFRMLGFNTNSLVVHSLLDGENGYYKMSQALYYAGETFRGIAGGKFSDGTDLIEANKQSYREIADLLGTVSELGAVASFRNDDKTYYSYSAPNYLDTQFKKFKSDDKRQEYLDSEFKKYKWFYDESNKIDDNEIKRRTQGRFGNFAIDYVTYNESNHRWVLNSNASYLNEDVLDNIKERLEEVNNLIPPMIERYRYNNTWLWQIQENVAISYNMQMKELKTIKDPYNDKGNTHADYANWKPLQIKRAFIQEFFSVPFNPKSTEQFAYYNFPIFSDSPVAKFIKFKKYVADSSAGSLEHQMLPLFRKVVKQELQRMRLIEDRQKAREEAQKTGGRGPLEIDYFDTNGRQFQFFPEFNDYVIDSEGNIIDTSGDYNKEEAASKGTYLKDKIIELGNDFAAIDELIDKAVKYNIDSLFHAFLQDFSSEPINDVNILRYDELNAFGKEVLDDLKAAGVVTRVEGMTNALKEYFWNQAFATTQIIQITTTDLAFYKDANDFQKRYKELYAAGTKLYTNSKYGKKSYKTMYLTDNIITSPSYMDIKKSLDDAVKEKHISEADRVEILEGLKGINVADAQAFRSLKGIRSVLDMMGLWTDEMDITYNNITSDKWTMDDLRTIWQTLKPFVYTQLDSPDGLGGRMKVPHQNKNSEFALLQAYVAIATGSRMNAEKGDYVTTTTSSPVLRAMSRFMMDNDIDVIQFQSAVKAGNQGDVNLNLSHKKLVKWAKEFRGNAKNMKKAAEEGDLKAKEMELFKTSDRLDINLLEKLFRNWYNNRLINEDIKQEEFNKTMDDMLIDEDEAYQILKDTAFPNGQESEEVVHTIPYDDYIIQQPTPEHLLDATAVFGSQFRNLIISDLPEDFQTTINGKQMGKKEIIDLYHSLVVENLLSDFEELQERFGSIENLQQELLSLVNGNPKYGRDMVDALQLVNVEDEDGNVHKEFNIPLYNPSTTLKIQELVMSMFKNKITKQSIKGGACILVTSFGFTDKLHVVHNEDGSIKHMECYMPAYSRQFFEPFMREDKDGNLYLDPSFLPEDLRKLIGYRIPTEDKYSMAPLYIKGFLPQENGSSIMLPAETTLFSGEDFDVDKKFLILPEYKVIKYDMRRAYEDYKKTNSIIEGIGKQFQGTDFDTVVSEDQSFREWFFGSEEKGGIGSEGRNRYLLDRPIFRKVKYDMSKAPQEQSRAARNNMIFDISYAILTNKDTAEKIHNPGSFTKAKRAARLTKIVEDSELVSMWAKDHNLTGTEELADSLLNASFEELEDFTKKYKKNRSQLTVDTFIYNHKQNMTGAALIGMYANNTSMQAKYQQTNLSIRKEYTFVINDRTIQSLHDIMSPLGERISKNCAELKIASLNNIKDPVLADLRQNTNTANIMGMMLRAGLSIQEASLLFMQPIVAEWIDTTGGDNRGDSLQIGFIDKYITILENNGGAYNKEAATRKNFTSKDLILNALTGINTVDNDNLASQIEAALLFKNIMTIANDVAELTRISRADSPNGALKSSLAGAYGQWERVSSFHELAKRENFTLEGIDSAPKNNMLMRSTANGYQYLYGDKDAIRDALLKSKMPMLQAFYSLGIESARKFLRPYFTQLTPQMVKATSTIEKNSARITLLDKTINTWFKDASYFALTKSKLFGDDGTHTYDQKRHYYLYEFPKKLMDIIAQNPDIAQLTAIKKLKVYKGEISMSDSAKLKQITRESLQRDFDMMLYMDNPQAKKLAIDLFMYSFYKEGYYFGPHTIGGMFSTLFLNSIPEYVKALRDIPKMMKEDWFFERFIPQFYANRYDQPYLFPRKGLTGAQQSADGRIAISFKKVKNPKTNSAFNYVTFTEPFVGPIGNYVLERVNGDTAIYTPMVEIKGNNFYDGTKYNANMTAKEVAETIAEEQELKEEAAKYNPSVSDGAPSIDSSAMDMMGAILDAYENGSVADPEAGEDIPSQPATPTTQGQNTTSSSPQSLADFANSFDDIAASIEAAEQNQAYDPEESNAQLDNPLC